MTMIRPSCCSWYAPNFRRLLHEIVPFSYLDDLGHHRIDLGIQLVVRMFCDADISVVDDHVASSDIQPVLRVAVGLVIVEELLSTAHKPNEHTKKIGRASCRERVCQYV